VASFLAPFYVRIQSQHFGDVMVVVVGPCWQFIWTDPPYFSFSPIPLLIFFPFWGPGLLIAKIAYDTARIQDLSRHDYLKKVVRVIFLQMLFLVFLVLPSTGYPEPIAIPLPVVGIAALLLTRVIVKEVEGPWEEPNRSKRLVFEGGRPWSFTPYNQLWKEVNSSTTGQEALHGARIHQDQVTL
jgi:hypothetical protein